MSVVPYGYGYGWAQPRTDSLATVAVILGGVGVACCALAAPVAIVTGIIARSRIRNSGGALTGEALATTGAILGAVAIALNALGVVAILVQAGLSAR
jgi:hypothetical protein